MTRKQVNSERTSDEIRRTPARFIETLFLLSERHLKELLDAFHRQLFNPTVQRMHAAAGGRLHLEDLADCYQLGFTAFYCWLDDRRENGQPLDLAGKTEADAWLRVSYRFFQRAVKKRLKKLANSRETDSCSLRDDEELTLEFAVKGRDVLQELANIELAKVITQAIDTQLTGDEAIVFRTYLDHTREFDGRSLFAPLTEFIERDHKLRLPKERVTELWKSGKARLEAYLTRHGTQPLREFIGDHYRAKESRPTQAPQPTAG